MPNIKRESRNEAIRRLYKWHSRKYGTEGLAKMFGLSKQRIHQIVKGRNQKK